MFGVGTGYHALPKPCNKTGPPFRVSTLRPWTRARSGSDGAVLGSAARSGDADAATRGGALYGAWPATAALPPSFPSSACSTTGPRSSPGSGGGESRYVWLVASLHCVSVSLKGIASPAPSVSLPMLEAAR